MATGTLERGEQEKGRGPVEIVYVGGGKGGSPSLGRKGMQISLLTIELDFSTYIKR